MADSTSGDEPPRTGRTRTWWHPLFAHLVSFRMRDAVDARPEAPVGEMPLRIDLLLVRREHRELSPEARHDLPELVPRLARYTIVELKGPTDSLERCDWETLLAHALLFVSQQPEHIANDELSLVLYAPALTEPFRANLQRRGLVIEPQVGEPGVHRIRGAAFATWVIETDRMDPAQHPIAALFSRALLRDPRHIMDELEASGHRHLLAYAFQQIQQFRALGEDFAMQHPDVDDYTMDQFADDLAAALVKELPPEKRLEGLSAKERIQGLSAEERLEGLSAEERLEGLSAEERLEGLTIEQFVQSLSPQARERLRKLIERQDGNSAGST